MKKHLSLLFRLVFSAAGIAYIAFSLTWTDHVILPEGFALEGGQILVEPLDSKVVHRQEIDGAGQQLLTLQVAIDDQLTTMQVRSDQLGELETQPHLKPGVLATLREGRIDWLIFGWLLIGPIYPLQAYRWMLLMRARGLEVSFAKAMRLTFVGCFFNLCMPGTTGGDLVKAYYTAARSDRRTDSVMSVIFDRITGLLGLVLLAGIASLFMLHDPLARQIGTYIWGGAALVALVSAFYFSRRLRRACGLQWLLDKLPADSLPAKIDQAAVAYSDHKGVVLAAILMSTPMHMAFAVGTALAGYALGADASLGLLLTVLPVLFLAGSLPLTYQGLGVMEGLAIAMIQNPPLTMTNQIVGMLLLYRVFQVSYSLIGAVFVLRGDVHMHPEQQAQAVADQQTVEAADVAVEPQPEPVKAGAS